uniref:Uncharacterized protein n=1 Tax=Rhizophora mucronata TaxID=61149 RepID=A0A2P2PAE1_RHIMU
MFCAWHICNFSKLDSFNVYIPV